MQTDDLAPPPPRVPIARKLGGQCPSCKDDYVLFTDGTTDKVEFNPVECEPDVLHNKDRSAPHTDRCTRCANDDWNRGECDVCGQEGFCDIVGLICPSQDPAALSVCYHCAIAGKYSSKWQKTGWEKARITAKHPREVAQNPLGIAKRGGAITKDKR